MQYKQAKNQRLHVELALMKLCHLPDAIKLAVGSEAQKKKSELKESQFSRKDTQEGIRSPEQEDNPSAENEADSSSKDNKSETPVYSLKNLSSLKNEVRKEREERERSKMRDIAVGEEEFLKVWTEFAEQMKKDGKRSLHMLMTANSPRKVEGNRFELVVATETLRETF